MPTSAPSGLTTQDAKTWLASDHPKAKLLAHLAGTLIHADTSDAHLAEIAAAATSDATIYGVALIGADRYLAERRDALRQLVRAQLTQARAQFVAAESVYEDVRTRRAALVARIIAWNVASDTDAALARDAGMSHTGISKIRTRITGTDDDPPRSEGA